MAKPPIATTMLNMEQPLLDLQAIVTALDLVAEHLRKEPIGRSIQFMVGKLQDEAADLRDLWEEAIGIIQSPDEAEDAAND